MMEQNILIPFPIHVFEMKLVNLWYAVSDIFSFLTIIQSLRLHTCIFYAYFEWKSYHEFQFCI